MGLFPLEAYGELYRTAQRNLSEEEYGEFCEDMAVAHVAGVAAFWASYLGVASGYSPVEREDPESLRDLMSPGEAEEYDRGRTRRNPVQSSPYDVRERESTRDGRPSHTTYDKYGRRHREYKFEDSDHGPHQHKYDYDKGAPDGRRSPAEPIDE